jgi:hypothetical protein
MLLENRSGWMLFDQIWQLKVRQREHFWHFSKQYISRMGLEAAPSTNSSTNSTSDAHHSYLDTAIGPLMGWHTTDASLLFLVIVSFILGSIILKVITLVIDRRFIIHKYFPYSAINIIVGVIVGIILRFSGVTESSSLVVFNSEIYFVIYIFSFFSNFLLVFFDPTCYYGGKLIIMRDIFN